MIIFSMIFLPQKILTYIYVSLNIYLPKYQFGMSIS